LVTRFESAFPSVCKCAFHHCCVFLVSTNMKTCSWLVQPPRTQLSLVFAALLVPRQMVAHFTGYLQSSLACSQHASCLVASLVPAIRLFCEVRCVCCKVPCQSQYCPSFCSNNGSNQLAERTRVPGSNGNSWRSNLDLIFHGNWLRRAVKVCLDLSSRW
jgi:hypothetical protein